MMQPLLDSPAAGARVRAGVVGAGGGRQPRRRPRPLARRPGSRARATPAEEGAADDRRQGASKPRARRRARPPRRRSRRSRTTRSCPTATPERSSPPTARSTGSASPASTRPSVFGSLLDREAGFFRFAPFGIAHPTARAYVPGTNVFETTWKTPSGWVVVRDALTLGPRDHEDKITPHTRPPADDDADHMLVRTVECLDGRVEIELVCEPAFDYGRTPATWTLGRRERPRADASRSRA